MFTATVSGRTRITDKTDANIVIQQLNQTKLNAIQSIWDTRFSVFVKNGLEVDINRRHTKRFFTIVQNTLGTYRKNYLTSLIPEEEKKKKKPRRVSKRNVSETNFEVSESEAASLESTSTSATSVVIPTEVLHEEE